MAREKRTPRKITPKSKAQTFVLNSTSPPESPTPVKNHVSETPESARPEEIPKDELISATPRGSSPLSYLPPSSQAVPSSPNTPIANGTILKLVQTSILANDEDEIATPVQPTTARGHNPTKELVNGRLNEDDAGDAGSTTSSKRKRSPSPDVTQSVSRDKRLRLLPSGPIKLNEDDFNPPYTPLTPAQKREWKGWVEIESEPIYVNTILREIGVQGVRAEEIIDLESGILAFEPPVYGLIFLFQYQDSDHVPEGEPCPPHVWFANQLPATNACATIAFINILLNSKNVDLGKPLTYFKEDTMDLTPMERAHCINEHEVIRGVHNSFASRIDMWLCDRIFAAKYRNQIKLQEKRTRDKQRALEAAARKSETPKQTPLKPKRKSASKSKKADEDEQPSSPEQEYDDNSAFHYVAYVPIDGHIWRLDGMSTHPQDVGPYTHEDSWLCDAAPHVQARMAEFAQASGVYFNLMALVKDTASRARQELAASIKALLAIEQCLDELSKDWRGFAEDLGDEILRAADAEMGITTELLTSAPEPADLPISNIEKLLQRRLEMAKHQEALRETIRVQKVKEANEQAKVEKDRLDLNPMIHRVLLNLEGEGVVQELMDRHRGW